MNCQRAEELIIDSLGDELAADERAALAEHMGGCADCARLQDEYRALWRDLGRLPDARPSPRVALELGSRVAANPGRRARFLRAAVLAGLVAGAGLIGRATAPGGPRPTAADSLPGYLLLIRADGPAAATVPLGDLVREYAQWASGLRAEGRLVAAEPLEAEPRWVNPEVSGQPSDISGFFYVRAASLDAALELARQSPHARYGGAIEVREVLRSDL